MIQIHNNALKENVFMNLQEYVKETQFNIQKAGDKEFLVIPTPDFVLPQISIHGFEVMLTFIRKAYKGFDNDLRIHNDFIIQGQKPELALVLYINEPEGVTPNGTAFWKHHKLGISAPNDLTNEEFDRLIIEDSNDLSKWEKIDYVSNIPNRMVLYSSKLFHSKYPKEIEEGERIVLVAFLKKI